MLLWDRRFDVVGDEVDAVALQQRRVEGEGGGVEELRHCGRWGRGGGVEGLARDVRRYLAQAVH